MEGSGYSYSCGRSRRKYLHEVRLGLEENHGPGDYPSGQELTEDL